MKKIVLFVSLFAVTYGFSKDVPLAQNETYPRADASAATQVVNGRNAYAGERPFQVSLQLNGFHFCGGSIVNYYWVVTAGHCTAGQTANRVTVIVGTIYYKQPGQIRQAVQIVNHRDYNPQDSYRNDIALIKVGSAFVYNNYVRPATFPWNHAATPGGTTATLSGWGALKVNGTAPYTLQVVDITVADPAQCSRAFSGRGTIYPTNICAYNPAFRQGQCSGDSGGPLTAGGVLVGIVSWSIKDPDCASTRFPGIYTRVSEYIDWLAPRVRN